MAKKSAGLLLVRTRAGISEVFLVHPGGPFWAKKDDGAWSLPKGEFTEDEAPLAAAIREFQEEIGVTVSGPFVSLGAIRQAGGKTVHAFAVTADIDPTSIRSNTFKLEWPPRSGRFAEFHEVDRAAWFSIQVAAQKINPGQADFLKRITALADPAPRPT
jgi:predicted NUDIX family NTP pyrophosphohydrolase